MKKIFYKNLVQDIIKDFSYPAIFKCVDCSPRAREVYMDIMLETNDDILKLMGVRIGNGTYSKYVKAIKQDIEQDRLDLEKSILVDPDRAEFFANCKSKGEEGF